MLNKDKVANQDEQSALVSSKTMFIDKLKEVN